MNEKTGQMNLCERSDIVAVTRRMINAGRVDWLRAIGFDLVAADRQGCYIWDIEGERYLDVLCDGSTYNFGHRNPILVQALRDHMNTLDIGCQFLNSRPRAELAELLVKTSPAGLNVVHFLPSGSEANDAAIKSALAATGREKIVSIQGNFHGVTGLAARATGGGFARSFGMQTAEDRWTQVPWNNVDAMEQELSKGDVAAVIMETVPATLGWPLPAAGYHTAVRELCTRYGTMLIIDEVQTGLGRCGLLWAIERWDVTPDILVMAKGAGGGLYPLAYILMTDQAASWTRTAPLAMPSTFGGSELGCALGVDVLRMAMAPEFLQNVNERADYLSLQLNRLRKKYPEVIIEVRQLGLAAALKFSDGEGGIRMMTALFANKVLSMVAANDTSVLQLKPPLIIDDAAIDELAEALDKSVQACFVDNSIAVTDQLMFQLVN